MRRKNYGKPIHKKYFGEFIARAYVNHIVGPTITISHPRTNRIAELTPIPRYGPGETKYFINFDDIPEKYRDKELLWSQALYVAFTYIKPKTVSSQTVELLIATIILEYDNTNDKSWIKL